MNGKLISIVVPVKDESAAIPIFFKETNKVLHKIERERGLSFEYIFVDDGSADDTLEQLEAAARQDSFVRVVSLSRNFGKEIAMTAGLEMATGDAIIFMDIDLQDPPALIEDFVNKWHEGYDVVYGYRQDRWGDSLVKRLTAKIYLRLFNSISTVSLPEGGGDYRIIDRRVANALKQVPERNRFMKGLFAWVGFKTARVPYSRAGRSSGSSSWNYWKLWNFGLDGLTGFSDFPLRIWLYVGAVVFVSAVTMALLIVVQKLVFGIDIEGYTSLIVAVLLFGGIQLLVLGVLGEYLGRVLVEVKNRPLYLIDKAVGFEDRNNQEKT